MFLCGIIRIPCHDGRGTLPKNTVIYYTDETKDEFSTAKIHARVIDGSYPYNNETPSRRLGHAIWYRIIARPLAFLYLRVRYHHRIVDCRSGAAPEGEGWFLYGNHTNAIADALIPSRISYPTDAYVIVHPDNVSMPVLGRITPSLGAIPLPDDGAAARNFVKAVQGEIERHHCVVLYPEAHIWPYYTKIRPFSDASFCYPARAAAPVYCFTNTYQRRGKGNAVDIVTYLDGPFYADKNCSAKEQRAMLRDQVYERMVQRSSNNNVELIRYIKKDTDKESDL